MIDQLINQLKPTVEAMTVASITRSQEMQLRLKIREAIEKHLTEIAGDPEHDIFMPSPKVYGAANSIAARMTVEMSQNVEGSLDPLADLFGKMIATSMAAMTEMFGYDDALEHHIATASVEF